jgi:hypothetical protein
MSGPREYKVAQKIIIIIISMIISGLTQYSWGKEVQNVTKASALLSKSSYLRPSEYSVLYKQQHCHHRIYVLGVKKYWVLHNQHLHYPRTPALCYGNTECYIKGTVMETYGNRQQDFLTRIFPHFE